MEYKCVKLIRWRKHSWFIKELENFILTCKRESFNLEGTQQYSALIVQVPVFSSKIPLQTFKNDDFPER